MRELDDSLGNAEQLIEIVKAQNFTLKKLQLVLDDPAIGYGDSLSSIDLFLRYFQVGLAIPPSVPFLSQLYISKDQEFNPDLLAEVLMSRNPASRGQSLEGIEGTSCSRLVFSTIRRPRSFRGSRDEPRFQTSLSSSSRLLRQ